MRSDAAISLSDLGAYNKVCLVALSTNLKDPNDHVRINTAGAMRNIAGDLKEDIADEKDYLLTMLAESLEDSVPLVRIHSAFAIVELGPLDDALIRKLEKTASVLDISNRAELESKIQLLNNDRK